MSVAKYSVLFSPKVYEAFAYYEYLFALLGLSSLILDSGKQVPSRNQRYIFKKFGRTVRDSRFWEVEKDPFRGMFYLKHYNPGTRVTHLYRNNYMITHVGRMLERPSTTKEVLSFIKVDDWLGLDEWIRDTEADYTGFFKKHQNFLEKYDTRKFQDFTFQN